MQPDVLALPPQIAGIQKQDRSFETTYTLALFILITANFSTRAFLLFDGLLKTLFVLYALFVDIPDTHYTEHNATL
jgi:hypothetical protein